ncbi:MAG: GntR family transcriptional regulator [Sphaerochaetaceae bacterium]|jgi:DNA-binding GntR family transcriptional regulator|nr:GntR family transcriptional regulator [Sphaerochaetaceae bacterium]MDD3671561.1 GntR family transcriptional regulator [Sphaerochaetaceae bacterium]MDD4259232.1 GntR family transcriptional regulator [Sphaerochaetaceae bacterium]MDD4762780.1 GntR family transcriptional regulator [Sphaerochaetaceae bacterium]MDD4840817.1 GntR family transcriptional regulator [Sphaerochaetaceae bacterium]
MVNTHYDEGTVNGEDLPNIIYKTLHKEILNLSIKPGQALLESDVCNRFNASRTPVRTAFQRLSDAGLLSIVPYKGAFATYLDFDYITQMIFMRHAVESKVIAEAIALDDPFLVEAIRYSLRCQRLLLDTPCTVEEFYTMDSQMHRLWFASVKRELLWQTIQDFEVHYTRFRMLDIVEVGNFRQIVEEHEQLFEAFEKRKAVDAERILETHLQGGVKRLGTKLIHEFSGYFKK